MKDWDEMSEVLSPETLRKALLKLGDALEKRGETATLTICGGTALNLLGVVSRLTEDVDSIRKLSPLIIELRNEVATELGIAEDWLNDTVAVAPGIWPKYFDEIIETEEVFRHGGLTVYSATREFLKILKAKAIITNPRGCGRHVRDIHALGFKRSEIPVVAAHIQRAFHSDGITNMLDVEIVTQLGICIFDDEV